MKVEWNSIVGIAYTLTDNKTGKELEKTPDENTMKFKFGVGELLPKFEKNILGLTDGDKFDFVVQFADAFGPVDAYAIFDIPKDTFEVDSKVDEEMLVIGNSIPLTDNKGNKHLGVITHILDDAVTMDFNHPLAGVDLRFSGNIIQVIE